jgi:hypothetical protein
MQIPQHGHSCSLQYKLNFSWCSLQCSLISNTNNGKTIDKIRQNRETNSGAVREHKIIVENEIQQLRTNINNHLDKLQDNMMKEFSDNNHLTWL